MSTIQINSLLTDYSQNYSYFRHTPLLLVKINNVTLRLVAADVSGTDLLGDFKLHLAPNPS
jgi:hypothetical protein